MVVGEFLLSIILAFNKSPKIKETRFSIAGSRTYLLDKDKLKVTIIAILVSGKKQNLGL